MKFGPPFDWRPPISCTISNEKLTKINNVDTYHMHDLGWKIHDIMHYWSFESAYKGRFFDFSDEQWISGCSGSIKKSPGLNRKRRHRCMHLLSTIFLLSESHYECVRGCRTFLRTNLSKVPLWFRQWRCGNKLKLFPFCPPGQASWRPWEFKAGW